MNRDMIRIVATFIALSHSTIVDTSEKVAIRCSSPENQLSIYDSKMYMQGFGFNNIIILKNYKRDYKQCFKDLKRFLDKDEQEEVDK